MVGARTWYEGTWPEIQLKREVEPKYEGKCMSQQSFQFAGVWWAPFDGHRKNCRSGCRQKWGSLRQAEEVGVVRRQAGDRRKCEVQTRGWAQRRVRRLKAQEVRTDWRQWVREDTESWMLRDLWLGTSTEGGPRTKDPLLYKYCKDI